MAEVLDPEITDEVSLNHVWNVVVYDDNNTMEHVVDVFMNILSMPFEKAHKHMMEVHTLKRSIVFSGEIMEALEKGERLVQEHLTAEVV